MAANVHLFTAASPEPLLKLLFFQNRPVFGKIRYMCADGIRRKFRNYIDEYVSINYRRAGRTLKLNNYSQSKTKKASGNVEPKLKKRRKTINK